MSASSEFEDFSIAMDAILRADPKAVKEAVDTEIKVHTAEREARGKHKRGRKPKNSGRNRDDLQNDTH
jgi:hypothetical protein